MKTLFSCLIILSISIPIYAQTEFYIGPGRDAESLSAAFQSINEAEGDNEEIILIITDDIVEPATAVLRESGFNGAYYNSITIYPESDGITISGNFAGPLIDLDGADNITIDGSVNQDGNTASLTLVNTSTDPAASTIRMTGSATNNTIKYCNIKGAGTDETKGIIFFDGFTAGKGNNSNNTIDHNKITRADEGRPYNAVYSDGTGGINSANTISSNEFFDHLSTDNSSCAINLAAGNQGFSITGNSFFETTSFEPSGDYEYNLIKINTTGTGFAINGNYIGSKAAACGGTAWIKNATGDNVFNGINVVTGTAASSVIDGNIIRKISWANSGNASWTGIKAEGYVLIGSSAGNFIGDPSTSGSITLTGGAAVTELTGISISGSGTIDCRKNTIANINNATTSAESKVTGIYFTATSAATNNVRQNFIHDLVVSASSGSSELYGIRIDNGAAKFSNNILSLGGNTPSTVYGFYETGTAGNNNSLYFNTVYVSGSPSSGNSYALYNASNTNARDFRNNILFNARTNGGSHYGLYIAVKDGAITCNYNDYHVSGTGGIIGHYGTDGDKLDKPVVTGQDANSLTDEPDLHNAGSQLASDYKLDTYLAGVSGTSIDIDYDGSARSSSPAMGAFEIGGCVNPTIKGDITLAITTGCSPFNPATISGTEASGHTGVLEYLWQQSTTSSTTGFTDISSSNSASYDPGPLTQKTWFRRLARVTCSADWSGAAVTDPIEITVNPLPSASITGDLNACLSTTLTAVTDAASPEYVWFKESSVISGQTSSTLPVNASGAYKVKIKNGVTLCEQTSPASDVVINTQPTITFSGSETSCVSTTLSVTTDALSPTYKWYKDNTEISGETGSTLNIISSGLYKVTIKNGVTLCERTSTNRTVTINPLPSVSITGSLTACTSTTLTAVSNAASPAYTWYRNDIVIGGETASTLNITSGGDYKVKVKDGITLCENTSAASTVTINPQPSASVTGTLTSCGSTVLTAVTDAASPSYVWYKDMVVIPGETSSTLTATSSGNYKFKVTNGITMCERISPAAAVTINPLPSATITTLPVTCASASLTANTDAASPSYKWLRDNVEIAGAVSSSYSANISGDYKVIVRDGLTTCENTSPATSISLNTVPTVTISGLLTACGSTTLSAGTNASSPSYKWYRNNILMAGETAGSLNVTMPGDYKVKVTDGINACENISAVSTVVLTALPSISVNGDLSVCAGTTLSAVTDASNPAFTWYKNSSIISGETNSSLAVTAPGDYQVKVMDGVTTCENTSTVSTIIINQPDASLAVSGTGSLCSGTGTFIIINSSEAGISYRLRTSAGTTVGAAVTGTGGALSLPTGNLTATTTFNVLATNENAGCSVQLAETETVSVDPLSAGGIITGGQSPVPYGSPTGTMTLTGYTGNIVKWQKAAGTDPWTDVSNPLATYSETPSSTGTWQYRVNVKSGSCPDVFSSIKQVVVNKADQTITMAALPDKILVGETLTLTATSSANIPVLFQSLDSEIASVSGTTLTGIAKGKATIRAYNDGDQNYNAAETTADIKVHSTHANILNLFTPNNDGINDYWELPAEWGKSDVKIYNRWGKLVFSNPEYDNLWSGNSEGSPLPEGAYFYIIKTENEGTVKGTLNIVR